MQSYSGVGNDKNRSFNKKPYLLMLMGQSTWMTSWLGDGVQNGRCPWCFSLIFMRVTVATCEIMVMTVVVVIRWRCVGRRRLVLPLLSFDPSRFPGFLGPACCWSRLQPLGHPRRLQAGRAQLLLDGSAVFMNVIVVMFMIAVIAAVMVSVRVRRRVHVVDLLVFVLFVVCVIVTVVVLVVVCVTILHLSVIVIMSMVMVMFYGCASSSLTAPSGNSLCEWMLEVWLLVWMAMPMPVVVAIITG